MSDVQVVILLYTLISENLQTPRYLATSQIIAFQVFQPALILQACIQTEDVLSTDNKH